MIKQNKWHTFWSIISRDIDHTVNWKHLDKLKNSFNRMDITYDIEISLYSNITCITLYRITFHMSWYVFIHKILLINYHFQVTGSFGWVKKWQIVDNDPISKAVCAAAGGGAAELNRIL